MYLGFQRYAAKFSSPQCYVVVGVWWVVVVVVGCVVAREETQPASCVAARRLCRHSAQTHPPKNASVLSRVLVLGKKAPMVKLFVFVVRVLAFCSCQR